MILFENPTAKKGCIEQFSLEVLLAIPALLLLEDDRETDLGWKWYLLVIEVG